MMISKNTTRKQLFEYKNKEYTALIHDDEDGTWALIVELDIVAEPEFPEDIMAAVFESIECYFEPDNIPDDIDPELI